MSKEAAEAAVVAWRGPKQGRERERVGKTEEWERLQGKMENQIEERKRGGGRKRKTKMSEKERDVADWERCRSQHTCYYSL